MDPSGHKSWKVPTDLVGYIIDVTATFLGVNTSFSLLKIVLNRAKSNKKFRNEAVGMVMKLLVVLEKGLNKAGKLIQERLLSFLGKAGDAMYKVVVNFIGYRFDKIKSKVIEKIIYALPYIISFGSFVAGLIDFSIHNKTLKGYIWTINGLKSWQVKLLNKLFA